LTRPGQDGKLSTVCEVRINHSVYKKKQHDIFLPYENTVSKVSVHDIKDPEFKVSEIFAGAGDLAAGLEKAGLKCPALNETDREIVRH